MLQHMEKVADNMIECLKEKSQQVSIRQYFMKFVFEIMIWKTVKLGYEELSGISQKGSL